jgi:hypothetical protein
VRLDREYEPVRLCNPRSVEAAPVCRVFSLDSASGVVHDGESFTMVHHMGNRHRLTISLNGPDYEALSVYAEAQERSLSWVIAQAVKRFLASEQPQEQLPFAVAEPAPERPPQGSRRSK